MKIEKSLTTNLFIV